MTKICPKCKENLHPTMPGVYGCGTPVRRLRDGSLFETKKCLRRQLAQAQGVIDRLPKMIHEAFCGGWEDRDEHADVGEYFGKADMDNDWRNSEAAKTK